jgi:N-6 DNA Methylase
MPDLRSRAVKIAEAAASAWWKAHGSSRDEIPLGVVAALALTTQADPSGPDPAKLILGADRDDIAELLRHIWTLFAITRPELSIRVGPFAAWLDDPTTGQLDGAHATAQALVKAGQLTVTGDRDLACEVDLLGHVYQELRNPKARKAHGEIYTPAPLATAMARLTLAGAKPGQSICDPCAGTGGLLRAAAQHLRADGVDPHTIHWYAADIDPVVVSGLAVNMHLWDLGPHVVVGCANVLAEPDWETRARAEQNAAIDQHNTRLLVARFLAAERLLTAAAEQAGQTRHQAEGTRESQRETG